jgi:ferritin
MARSPDARRPLPFVLLENPMLSKTMTERLNGQINLEFYSSNLYLQMGAWCERKGYDGCGAFLKQHAAEEMMHMQKLFNYVSETGGLPIVGSISAPPAEFSDLRDVFQQTLEHERFITGKINDVVAVAFEEKDFSSFQFLQWYVAEQHEEEALFQGILDKLEMIGIDGRGIYFLDQEIGKLAASRAAVAQPAQ